MAADPEVIDAINATMVPNGVKAINADSVRNLLLLMAEKLGGGSGSGSGGGGNIVFYLGMPEDMAGGSTTLTPEQQAHNAQMYSQLSQLPFVPVVGLDVSDMLAPSYGFKLPVTMSSVMTIVANDDIAQHMGLESGMVQLSFDEMDVMVAADGSVMFQQIA